MWFVQIPDEDHASILEERIIDGKTSGLTSIRYGESLLL